MRSPALALPQAGQRRGGAAGDGAGATGRGPAAAGGLCLHAVCARLGARRPAPRWVPVCGALWGIPHRISRGAMPCVWGAVLAGARFGTFFILPWALLSPPASLLLPLLAGRPARRPSMLGAGSLSATARPCSSSRPPSAPMLPPRGPGNILVRPRETQGWLSRLVFGRRPSPQLVFLDHGLYIELPEVGSKQLGRQSAGQLHGRAARASRPDPARDVSCACLCMRLGLHAPRTAPPLIGQAWACTAQLGM